MSQSLARGDGSTRGDTSRCRSVQKARSVLLTVIVILGAFAILSLAFFCAYKTDARHVRLRTWLVELEIEREPKPKRRALPRRRR